MAKDPEVKAQEKKEGEYEMVKVRVLRTTFLNQSVQAPMVKGPKGEMVPNILKVHKTPRVDAAIAQNLIEVV